MARPKLGEGDTQRLHIKISPEELQAIDDFRFANRIESRSEAVRRLVKIALVLESSRSDLIEGLRKHMNADTELNSAIVEEMTESGRYLHDVGPVQIRLMKAFGEAAKQAQRFALTFSAMIRPINIYRATDELSEKSIESAENAAEFFNDLAALVDTIKRKGETS